LCVAHIAIDQGRAIEDVREQEDVARLVAAGRHDDGSVSGYAAQRKRAYGADLDKTIHYEPLMNLERNSKAKRQW
jgi:hypothetical protein